MAALMVHEGRIVVVRHRKGDSTYHLLPGGGVQWGESLDEALVREVAEETGFECELGRVLTINDTIAPDDSRHLVNITFECAVIGGALTDSPDDARIEAVELVESGDLLDLDFRPPIAPRLLAALDDPGSTPAYLGTVFTPETGDADGGSST